LIYSAKVAEEIQGAYLFTNLTSLKRGNVLTLLRILYSAKSQ